MHFLGRYTTLLPKIHPHRKAHQCSTDHKLVPINHRQRPDHEFHQFHRKHPEIIKNDPKQRSNLEKFVPPFFLLQLFKTLNVLRHNFSINIASGKNRRFLQCLCACLLCTRSSMSGGSRRSTMAILPGFLVNRWLFHAGRFAA